MSLSMCQYSLGVCDGCAPHDTCHRCSYRWVTVIHQQELSAKWATNYSYWEAYIGICFLPFLEKLFLVLGPRRPKNFRRRVIPSLINTIEENIAESQLKLVMAGIVRAVVSLDTDIM